MCGNIGAKIVAAIIAAAGLVIFFSAVAYQLAFSDISIVVIYLMYLVALLFLGAAKMIMWQGWSKKKAAEGEPVRPARRRRRRR